MTESLARFALANTMVGEPSLSWIGDWDVPVMALLVGAVLVTFARLTRISAAMREDLEGTV